MTSCQLFKLFTIGCWTSILATSCIGLPGCQGGTVPIKDIYPRIQVEGQKGLLGASAKVVISSEFNGNVHLAIDPETGKVNGLDATMVSAPSGTYPGLTDFTANGYVPSQNAYWTGFNTWSQIQWNGVNQLATTLAQAGAPLLASAIKYKGEAQVIKAATPAIVSQAASQLLMGKTGASPINPSYLWSMLPDEIKSGVSDQFPAAVPSGAVSVTTAPKP